MKRILIISHNEICHNARLLKAGDYLKANGFDVVLFNPLTGIATKEVYETCINKRNWEMYEADIRKHSLKSSVNWFIVSVINKFIRFIWKHLRLKTGHPYFFNKGLLFFPSRKIKNIDYILVHVIDSLPFAVKMKKKYNAKLIFDSQEYFKGQYSTYPRYEYDWVRTFEKKYIKDVDILIATTNIMLKKIISDYDLKIPAIRVRNLPVKNTLSKSVNQNSAGILKLVWHGMSIIPHNQRGISTILKAVSLCKTDVILYLQGRINPEQKKLLDETIVQLNIPGKVKVIPPANPEQIIESLLEYDIGMIGELPSDENQLLTSSNKLFEYIYAGLAVIAPMIPGINETLDEYPVALKYPVGDFKKMAELIDHLNEHPDELLKLKENSRYYSQSELFWENDYKEILKYLV